MQPATGPKKRWRREAQRGAGVHRKRLAYRAEREVKERRGLLAIAVGGTVALAAILVAERSAGWDATVPTASAMLTLAAASLVGAVWDTLRQLRVHRWPAASCTIEVKDVDLVSSTGGGSVFVPRIHYTYEVDGVQYVGDKVGLWTHGVSSHAAAEAKIRRYTEGDPARCYYDPRRPSRAVLERRFSPGVPVGLILSAFLFVALAFPE